MSNLHLIVVFGRFDGKGEFGIEKHFSAELAVELLTPFVIAALGESHIDFCYVRLASAKHHGSKRESREQFQCHKITIGGQI